MAAFNFSKPILPGSSVLQRVFDVPMLERGTVDANPKGWGEAGFRVSPMTARTKFAAPLPPKFAASFRLAWNSRGLIALVEVKDAVVLAGNGDSIAGWDGLEIILAERRGSLNYYQLLVAPEIGGPNGLKRKLRHCFVDHRVRQFYNPRLQKNRVMRLKPLEAEIASVQTSDGYIIEVLLPWANLGLDPAEGAELGVQLGVWNKDKADERDSGQAIWYPTGWAASDPRQVNRIRLATEPSDPGVDAQQLVESISMGADAGLHDTSNGQFYFWASPSIKRFRGVYVTLPGSGYITYVDPQRAQESAAHLPIAVQREFAEANELVLMGYNSQFKNVGTDELLSVLREFSTEIGHPELANAPLLVDGFSRGGISVASGILRDRPDRLIAFASMGAIDNSPGTEFSAASMAVPGILYDGAQDKFVDAYRNVFAENRKNGALWSLAIPPGIGHVVGHAQHLVFAWYTDILGQRLPKESGVTPTPMRLKPIVAGSGWLGNPQTYDIAPVATYRGDHAKACWFPSQYTAEVWRALMSSPEFNIAAFQRILRRNADIHHFDSR